MDFSVKRISDILKIRLLLSNLIVTDSVCKPTNLGAITYFPWYWFDVTSRAKLRKMKDVCFYSSANMLSTECINAYLVFEHKYLVSTISI